MAENLKSILVDGAKFYASGSYLESAGCYAKALNLSVAEEEVGADAEALVLMAASLYQHGLNQGNVFNGGVGDDEGEQSDESGEEDDQPSEKDENNIDSNLYQFQLVEEDLSDGEDEGVGLEGGELNEIEEDEAESEDEADSDEGDENESVAESDDEDFTRFLKYDPLQAAAELLTIAQTAYERDTSMPRHEELGRIFDLLGDVSMEMEQFAQSILDYTEAIKHYKTLKPVNEERITDIYLKIAETLRWCKEADGVTNADRKKHLENAKKLLKIRLQKTGTDADTAQLEQIEEDIAELNNDEPKLQLSAQDKDVLKQLIAKKIMGFDDVSNGNKDGSVTDLTSMVKKKKPKHKK